MKLLKLISQNYALVELFESRLTRSPRKNFDWGFTIFCTDVFFVTNFLGNLLKSYHKNGDKKIHANTGLTYLFFEKPGPGVVLYL